MNRLQRFLGRELDLDVVRDEATLSRFGAEERYVPEELDIFDELEFGLGSHGTRTVVLVMVLEHGKLERVSLGWIPEGGSEDDFAAFSESELAEVMQDSGARLEAFFEAALPERKG
jgi:hypothetical protein